jgi:small-conductance mechanosensitive channel
MNDLAAQALAWRASLVALLAGLVVGWLGGSLLYRRLRALARRTDTLADDLLLDASRGLWLPFSLAIALLPAARLSPLEPGRIADLTSVARVVILVVLTIFFSRGLARWIATTQVGQATMPGRPSLLANAARIAVMVAGLLLVLDNVGFQITTLLTALGVGSLAVGLALQPTLSNFFAGIHLSVSKPIRIGDFVELDDGTQGEVVDIGWRTTKIRQLANNLAIVPNARLAEMRILNFSMPRMPQAAIVEMGVAYGSDLRKVARVALEVAQSVQVDLDEADHEHDPAVRFHAFGDSSIDFRVILRARSVVDRWPLVSEFIQRVKERFDAEGIEIPFPQRVVHLEREPAAPPSAGS